jgi:hypothetical protein
MRLASCILCCFSFCSNTLVRCCGCISQRLPTDPLCVVQNYHEEVHKVMKHGCCVGTALTKTGSHLPFYEGLFMGNWAEKVTFEFFDAFLASEAAKTIAEDAEASE